MRHTCQPARSCCRRSGVGRGGRAQLVRGLARRRGRRRLAGPRRGACRRRRSRRWPGRQNQAPGKQETTPIHPAISHVLRFFRYEHLPEKLQQVSRPFAELAQQVAERAPDNQETTVALRKLLEAKDAAVRAVL